MELMIEYSVGRGTYQHREILLTMIEMSISEACAEHSIRT